jgi:predicted AAA+ superfamily ATPase
MYNGIHYSNLRLIMENISRIIEFPTDSFFLFGPRGTGKSTLLKRRVPDALYIDLLNPERFRSLQARPERLGELMAGSPTVDTVVIDEIQRIPELLNVVHVAMEESASPRFILTGSSARKLRRGGTNLLGGRAKSLKLHPFMACELGEFNIESALRVGMIPLVLDSHDPEGTLAGYASLYLEQEVQAEGLTRNVGAFSRFLEAMSFSHGAILNATAVSRECEIERRTVVNYIDILEDLLLGFRLPVFTRRAKRKTARHPKFYYFDSGVFRSVRPRGPLDSAAGIHGAGLEGLVAQHLRAWVDYTKGRHELAYWRTRGGSEVDFITYGELGFYAIEVKNSRRVDKLDLRGLKAFLDDYPEAEAGLIYRGEERRRIDGIWCIPAQEFLPGIEPGRALRFDI